jgi:biopolymer transport protein ExbB
MNLLLFIQNEIAGGLTTVTTVPATETFEAKMNLWDLTLKGGLIMIPIALLLVIAIAILIERVLVISKAEKQDSSFMNRIKDYIHEGKIESAINLCRVTNTP